MYLTENVKKVDLLRKREAEQRICFFSSDFMDICRKKTTLTIFFRFNAMADKRLFYVTN